EERDAALAGEAVQRLRIPTCRPDDARNVSFESRANVGLDRLRCGEVDHRVRRGEVAHEPVPGLLERRRERTPDLPAASVEGDFHAARARSAGLIRATAS